MFIRPHPVGSKTQDLIIPATVMEEGGELESFRSRQALIPDLRIRLPPTQTGSTAHGPSTDLLAELKFVSAGVNRYPLGNRAKATDRRARGLPATYKRPLAKLDQRHHGSAPGQVGPLQRRLESFGVLQCLVIGCAGEGSQDLHSLIQSLADSRARYQSRATGHQVSEAEQGMILSQYRRILSCTFVRAQAQCLLSRMGHMGSRPERRLTGGSWR